MSECKVDVSILDHLGGEAKPSSELSRPQSYHLYQTVAESRGPILPRASRKLHININSFPGKIIHVKSTWPMEEEGPLSWPVVSGSLRAEAELWRHCTGQTDQGSINDHWSRKVNSAGQEVYGGRRL